MWMMNRADQVVGAGIADKKSGERTQNQRCQIRRIDAADALKGIAPDRLPAGECTICRRRDAVAGNHEKEHHAELTAKRKEVKRLVGKSRVIPNERAGTVAHNDPDCRKTTKCVDCAERRDSLQDSSRLQTKWKWLLSNSIVLLRQRRCMAPRPKQRSSDWIPAGQPPRMHSNPQSLSGWYPAGAESHLQARADRPQRCPSRPHAARAHPGNRTVHPRCVPQSPLRSPSSACPRARR